MAELFQTTPQNITLHLKALYAEGEILPEATCKEDFQVRSEGGRQVRRLVKFYNLDAILAVGYRVRSQRGTQFFQLIQNKLHFAVTGKTVAELIAQRADSNAPNKGPRGDHVAGLRRRPGAPAQGGLFEGLGRKTGRVPEVQRA